MSKIDVTRQSIRTLGTSYRSGALSPVDVTRAYLERIEALDGRIGSFITQTGQQALAAARKAEREMERGIDRGPLHGIPIGLKDNFATRGVRTTCGSRVMWDYIPSFDATVVRRLRTAGAFSLGKLHLSEFAYGGPNRELIGTCRNPWNLDYATGGSSSGSGAAIAASLCAAALGTDTSGSIRLPSSYCGVVGIKPTNGLVSRYGVTPLSWTLDCVGPLARNVEDAAILLGAIAGGDAKDPTSSNLPVPDYAGVLGRSVEGTRVGVPREYFFDECDAEVERAVKKAAKLLEAKGCEVSEVHVPWMKYAKAAGLVINSAEAAYLHEKFLKKRAMDYGPAVSAIASGLLVTATQYIRAIRARDILRQKMFGLFGRIDIMVAPSSPTPAQLLEESFGPSRAGRAGYWAPLNLLGCPALSLPCGFSAKRLPIGLQVVGRPFDETTVFKVAHAYESGAKNDLRPPI